MEILNKVQIQSTDNLVVDKLKRFLRKGMFNSINEDVLTEGFQKRILYPTNDFHLTKEQFHAIKCLLQPDENLILFQMGFDDGFFSPKNSYYKINCDINYREYDEIWIDSISALSSDTWEWLVLIDEALEGGLGVFIASEEVVKKFSEIYVNMTTDIIRFVELFLYHRNPSPEMIKFMMDILCMCKQDRGRFA